MVPESIKLESIQLQKFERFREFITTNVPKETQAEALEENCCPSSPFSWAVYPSGFGDIIHVTAFDHLCNLTIDDDGEMFKDEWENGTKADSL